MSTFPTSLNNFVAGDVIESEEYNAIETKIGINSSAVTGSLDYLLKNSASSNPGHCFDAETEILTESGWRFYDEIQENDYVVSLNKQTGKFEYNKIKEKFVYSNFSELYKIDGVNIDLAVTDKHGLVANNKNGGFELFTAEELFKTKKDKDFISAGILDKNGIDLSDDEIRLLVWIVADGNLEKDKRDNKIRIRFKLAKERKIQRLSKLLDRLNISFSKHPASGSFVSKLPVTRFTIHSQSYGQNFSSIQKVLDFIGYPKRLPDKIREANKRQVDIILDEYANTDGSISKHTLQICSAKEEEIDLLQEIIVLNGYRCNKVERPTQWILSISLNNYLSKFRGKIKKILYNGNVWCVSVDNGTLLIRRNGKVCITQNSHTLVRGATDVTASVAEVNYLVGVTSAVQSQLNTKIASTRTISTTTPLSGGGDLSADRTLSLTTVPANLGGTGVANNVASTITITGSFALGITLSAVTSVTFPIAGTLVSSVTTGNGVSATNTAGALAFTLGVIAPTSVNGLTLVAATTGFTIAGGTTSKTLTVPLDASVSGTNTGDNAANSSTMYIGTTAVALNRGSAALVLTGITSIDGNAATVTGLSVTGGKTLTVTDSATIAINSITLAGGEVITFSATNALTLATTGATSVTLPTTGTLVSSVTTGNGVSATNTAGALAFTLGAITPSTVNGLTITASAGTLTIANNASAALVTSGNFSITLTATAATISTLPAGTHSLAPLDTPVFTTNITTPLVIGGAGTTSTLTLRTTSGAGTGGADIIFQSGTDGGTELMRLVNSGYLGIGTGINIDSRLHIQGTGSFITAEPSANDGQLTGLKSTASGGDVVAGFTTNSSTGEVAVGGFNANYFLNLYAGNAVKLAIATTGVVTIANLAGTGSRAVNADANGVLSAASDERMKTNFKDLTSEVDVLSLLKEEKIKAVYFNWIDKTKGERRELGFTAQMWEDFIPEITGDEGEDNHKYLDYQKIVAVLWEQNKKLLERIKKLEISQL